MRHSYRSVQARCGRDLTKAMRVVSFRSQFQPRAGTQLHLCQVENSESHLGDPTRKRAIPRLLVRQLLEWSKEQAQTSGQGRH
jgi:hypothetical protein